MRNGNEDVRVTESVNSVVLTAGTILFVDKYTYLISHKKPGYNSASLEAPWEVCFYIFSEADPSRLTAKLRIWDIPNNHNLE